MEKETKIATVLAVTYIGLFGVQKRDYKTINPEFQNLDLLEILTGSYKNNILKVDLETYLLEDEEFTTKDSINLYTNEELTVLYSDVKKILDKKGYNG